MATAESDLWAAAYLLGDGCSNDAFAFRPGGEDAFFEEIAYVAGEVHMARTGSELPEVARPRPATARGERWSEEDLPSLYPRLWALVSDDVGA